jgi:hypothetical protein
MAIQAAAGYPQFSGNLIHPMFSAKMLELYYCDTVFSEVSTTEYSGEITKCGDQITFFRDPEVEVRDLEKNGTLEHDTPTVESTTMTIDYAKYFSFKYDRIDQKQICTYDQLISAIAKRAAYAIRKAIDPELLAQMWAAAAASNRGANAGEQTGAYDLGEVGADIQISATNANQVFSRGMAVLEEACAPTEQGVFLVVPPIAKQIIQNSDLKAGYFIGGDGRSPYLTGSEELLRNGYNGMQIIVSRFLPSTIDPTTGRQVWLCVAGVKSATAFAMQLSEEREMQSPEFFGTLYQGLAVYGFKTLYPKGLVAFYVSFTAS